MIIDTGYSGIIVPSVTGGFGIACTSQTNCNAGGKSSTCQYAGQSVQCTPGQVDFNFFETHSPDQGLHMFNFQLFTGVQSWTDNLGQSGILGLSPSSLFWSDLISNYSPGNKQYMDISILYKIKSEENAMDLQKVDMGGSVLTLNGRTSSQPQVFTLQSAASQNLGWTFSKVNVGFWANDGGYSKAQTVCIDNTANYYLMLSPTLYPTVTSRILSDLCRGEGQTCSRDSANVANVDNIRLQFVETSGRTVLITLKPTDFVLYGSDDNSILAIGQSQPGACGGADITLGRLFFTKAELTMRTTAKAPQQLYFGIAALDPPKGNARYVLTVLGGTLVLAIIITGVLVKTFLADTPEQSKSLVESVE